MPKLIACRPNPDYTLWVSFADGLEGTVDVSSLVDIGAFSAWRDVRLFLTARVDPDTNALIWPQGGVRLASDLLWRDIGMREVARRDDPAGCSRCKASLKLYK